MATCSHTRRPKSFIIRSHETLEKYRIEPQKVMNRSFHIFPPWMNNFLRIDYSLTEFPKSRTTTIQFRKAFQEKLYKYRSHYQMYTDGSKTGQLTGSAVYAENFKIQKHLPFNVLIHGRSHGSSRCNRICC